MIARKTPLKPGRPLVRRTPLRARSTLRATPIAQVSEKRAVRLAAAGARSTFLPARPEPAVPPKVRAALRARSGGVCEIQLPGCTGTAVDPSHRKKVGAGGRHGEAKVAHDVLSNLLDACRADHDELHRRPAWAKHPSRGWMLDEGQDPVRVPVLYRGVLSWLADDGSVIAVRAVAA